MAPRQLHRQCLYCDNIFETISRGVYHCNIDCAFYDKYIIDEQTGCWDWKVYIPKGTITVRFKYNNVNYRAIRFAYEKYNGPIPKEKHLTNNCDRNFCINPDHKKLVKKGSHISNIKLSPEQVHTILNDSRAQREIAKDYNISQGTVHQIKCGKIRNEIYMEWSKN